MESLAKTEIEIYLDANEKLLWASMPNKVRRKELRCGLIVGLGFFLLVSVTILTAVGYSDDQYGVFHGLKIIALFCGIIAFFSALIFGSLRYAGREFYGVTSKRVVYVRKGFLEDVKSIRSEDIELLWLEHLHIDLTNLYVQFQTGMFGWTGGFEAIKNGVMVKELIDQHDLTKNKSRELRSRDLITDEIRALRPNALGA